MELKDFPAELIEIATEMHLSEGDILVSEGTAPTHFYVLTKGKLEVLKKAKHGENHRISILKKGDIIGERGVIHKKNRSATIRALQASSVLAFPLNKLRADLVDQLAPRLARAMAEQLRYANETTVITLEKRLEEAKIRDLMGYLMVVLFSVFAVYIILLNTLMHHYSLYVFVLLMIVLGAVAFSIVRRSGFSLARVGFAPKSWIRSALQSLPPTFLLIGLTIVVKWAYISLLGIQTEPLFDPLYAKVPFTQFLTFVSVYILLAPVQELLARGVIQSVLTHLLSDDRRRRVWLSIFLSNLLFASLHAYISIGLVISAFLPGLFWGYLYAKQRDLVGVSVSHIILGTWAFAFLGFTELFS